jgi:hypothetical protein
MRTVRPVRKATDGRPAAAVRSGGKPEMNAGPRSVSSLAAKLIIPGPLIFRLRVFAGLLRFVNVRKRGPVIIAELANKISFSPLGRFAVGTTPTSKAQAPLAVQPVMVKGVAGTNVIVGFPANAGSASVNSPITVAALSFMERLLPSLIH